MPVYRIRYFANKDDDEPLRVVNINSDSMDEASAKAVDQIEEWEGYVEIDIFGSDELPTKFEYRR